MVSEVDRLRAGARALALIDAARERRAGHQVTERPPFELGQLLEVLNAHGVRFVVIDGVAMRFYDASRLTDDLDICYERSRATAGRWRARRRSLSCSPHDWDGLTCCRYRTAPKASTTWCRTPIATNDIDTLMRQSPKEP
jgi:hypothetical protein